MKGGREEGRKEGKKGGGKTKEVSYLYYYNFSVPLII